MANYKISTNLWTSRYNIQTQTLKQKQITKQNNPPQFAELTATVNGERTGYYAEYIHSFRSLSYDMSVASSKASSPQGAS
jgi:hypothetical protein